MSIWNGGEIELFGKNVHAYAYQVFRDSISYISQDIKLFRASIYENILYGNRNATMEEVIQAAKLSYADEFIQKLDQGYETVLNESGVSLSGGQLQRLAIARAFLKNAPVLLIDEATSALDPHSERQVTDAISLLSENRTVITVSHRLSTIEHADRIFVFDHQTLAEDGTYDELLQKHGAYYELHH